MKKEVVLAFFFFVLISLIFFYPFLKGLVALPLDLLAGEYEPYKSYSFLGYSPGGIPNKAQGIDVIRMIFPWKYFSIEQLKIGHIPFWNPYNLSGNPQMANLQSGVFYPLNILFFVLPFLSAWNIYIMLQPILAGIFTYLFLREIKISRMASIFGGLVFSFSSFMAVWIEYGNLGHSYLWLPLILLLILKYLNKPSISQLSVIIFILTFSVFAGYIQLTIYLYLFSIFFILAYVCKHKIKVKIYLPLFIAFLCSLFLSAVQLLPTLEIFQQSARNAYGFNQLSERLMPVFNLVTLMVPDFFGNPASRNYWLSGTYIERVSYIGVTPLLFVFLAFFTKKSFYKIFFIISAALVLVSTLDIYPIKLIHSIGIPILSTGVPTRILFLFSFCLAVLASIGFDNWYKNLMSKKKLIIFALPLGVYCLIWIYTLINSHPNYLISKKNLILPSLILTTGIIILFSEKIFEKTCKTVFQKCKFLTAKNITALILIALVGFDLFYFFHKITPFVNKDLLYPETKVFKKLKEIQKIDRVWGYGTAFIDANIQTYEKIFSTDGYEPLYIRRYGELLSASKNGKISKEISRSTTNIYPGFGKNDLKDNYYRQRVFNLLGVKYILAKKDQEFPDGLYNLIWEDGKFRIYENQNSVPRIKIYSNYIIESDKNKIIDLIFDKKIDIEKTLILEENLPSLFRIKYDPLSDTKIKTYTPNEIVLQTKSASDGLLFISDNYFPGWKVSIDGQEGKLYRADYSFRAVPIKSGNHEIIFDYNPSSFNLGWKISLFTFCGIVIFTLIVKIKRKYAKE